MAVIVGIIYFIGLTIFIIYSLVAIKQASRFRYLSARTVYLTLFYVGSTSLLIAISLISFFTADWS